MKTITTLLLKLVNIFIGTGLWLFGLGTLGWYLLRFWPGERFWPVLLLNYFMPWLLLILIPALGLAGLLRRPYLAAMLALPTLLISLNFAPLFLPRSPVALAGNNQTLKVMSYNVWAANDNLEALVEVIRREQPDILLLQELRVSLGLVLVGKLDAIYPGERLDIAYDRSLRQGVISRYPLTPQGSSYKQGRVQKVLVETPAGPVTVWNVHLSQPTVWRLHTRQTKALAAAIAAFDGPLIVGGDFNTTDQSDAYNRVNRYLDNAHWEAGWGFGFSFPAHEPKIKDLVPVPLAIVRIDHIFYSDHFFVHAARTVSAAGGSDHLPVAAELSFVGQ